MAAREIKMVACDECGFSLPERDSVVSLKLLRGHRVVLCGECMRRDEVPPEVVLARSSWTPWNEEPVIPIGDLMYTESVIAVTAKNVTRRRIAARKGQTPCDR